MVSDWMAAVYGVGGGLAVVLLARLFLCCIGFACFGVRKFSLASRIHSDIGDVDAGSCFAQWQSAGAGGLPWFINLLLFLFGFATTGILLVIEFHGGFGTRSGNSTVDANVTDAAKYLSM